jgi:hypothetical protein
MVNNGSKNEKNENRIWRGKKEENRIRRIPEMEVFLNKAFGANLRLNDNRGQRNYVRLRQSWTKIKKIKQNFNFVKPQENSVRKKSLETPLFLCLSTFVKIGANCLPDPPQQRLPMFHFRLRIAWGRVQRWEQYEGI